MDKTIELKIYDVYVKYVEMTMDDGVVLVYEAYSPFPRGHKIEKQLVKLSLKDAMNKINAMDDNDGLRMDHHGGTAYAPSTIRKVKWSKDEDIARGTYLADVSGSKEEYKLGDVVTVGDNSYKCAKIIDWTANFGTKFLYCTKVPTIVEKEVVKEVVGKVEVKDKTK